MLKSKRHFLNWIKENSKLLPIKEKWYILNWIKNSNSFDKKYQEVEYIESTEAQYIDTRYVMTSDVVEYGVKCYGVPPTSTSIFGSESSSTPKYSGVPFTNMGSTALYIGNTTSLSPVRFKQNDWNTYIVKTSSKGKGEVILNGDSTAWNYTEGIQKTYSIYLFANNKSDVATQRTSLKIASFYIKDNGVIVRNLISARRKSDNELGMYDTVTNTFFTNAGTGEFIKGGNK